MAYIYKITNNINGVMYVGQTICPLKKRWNEHRKWGRRTPTEASYRLYKAMYEFGVDNFSIEVIEECHAEDLDRLEIYWIKKLDTFYHGYNMTEGGQNRVCERLYSLSNTPKPIGKYTLKGELVAHYNTIKKGAQEEKVSSRTLRDHLRNRAHTPTVKGFIWALDSDTSYIERVRSGEIKVKIGTGLVVKQYDLEGNYVATYNSCPEAAKAVGTTCTQIGYCINHTKRYKTAGGFQWCKEGEENCIKVIQNKRCGVKQKVQVIKEGVTLLFNSIKEASKALGVSQTSIKEFCSGITAKNSKGYTFKIIND